MFDKCSQVKHNIPESIKKSKKASETLSDEIFVFTDCDKIHTFF